MQPSQGFLKAALGRWTSRMLTLRGATLLHAAAEFGLVEAVQLLLERGADVNARALIDDAGVADKRPSFMQPLSSMRKDCR